MEANPVVRDLVLIGGGHSHVILLRKLAMDPVPGLQVTLITPDVKTAYSGMLPGVVAGHYHSDDIHIDLVPLCRFAGARLFKTRATDIDPVARTIECEGRPDVDYDVLSIDVGITPALDNVPGAREHAIAVKPINTFLQKWETFLQRALGGGIDDVGFVGAGAGGVELCLAVAFRLEAEFERNGRQSPVTCHLFSDRGTILPDFDAGVQRRFLRHCEKRGIGVHLDFPVASVGAGAVTSFAGEVQPVDEIFWITAASSQPWLSGTGLDLDDRGFITVRETLQSTNYENVFAVGDIAHMLAHPRPKAGVFAVRQGPPLARNIRRLLLDRPLKPFKPQQEFLSLITTGDRYAIASRNRLSVEGRWVWHWKDRLDRRFMRRFNELPPMTAESGAGLLAGFDEQMRCGGCGAKVSAGLLMEVLDNLGGKQMELLDDAALFEVPDGRLMLHTVDSFRSFIGDPWIFAQVAVHHALSDIYAMGGKPVTALAIVTLPYAAPAKMKALLQQLMAGALAVLDQEDVRLIGGHTSEGAELALGFAVNGLVREEELLKKSGMHDGDLIVLTKPLGTGALFAADMQHRAKGTWIDEALAWMRTSNRPGLECFRRHGATACTDVTGFGLAGHLREMLAASTMQATVDLDNLPALPGSLEVINDMGITSTLHEGNRASAGIVEPCAHGRYELLFDPQTAGGLMATVPAAQATSCVNALKEAGYDGAAVIGRVSASPVPTITLKSGSNG